MTHKNQSKKMSHKYISSVNKSVVSVNNWEDVKKVEQVEDCFILEFDPTHKQKPQILLNIVDVDDDDDDDDDDDVDDDDEIIGSIVCVRKREDVKKVEEFEDCFILEFNPCEEEEDSSIDLHFSKCSVSVKTELVSDDDDEELSVLAVKGQVACRDYPHPRHLCAKHPFGNSPHEVHCEMCYCYVCDTSAPCKKWTQGCKDPGLKHCDATPNVSCWRTRRDRKKLRNKGRLQ